VLFLCRREPYREWAWRFLHIKWLPFLLYAISQDVALLSRAKTLFAEAN
jgi:hypothetical protein